MPLYEHVMLVRPDLSVQQAEQTVSGFKALIEDGGGKVSKVENWGLRGTAYRIKKNRKAHYSLMNIDAESELVAEMERQMRLNEDVLRFMTIAVDEHEDGPSVMMQKRDRDRDDKKRRSNGFARGPSSDEQPGQRAERTPEPTAEA